jgi:hypothetical protein
VEDLQTKEQMKADGIKSPDRADSLAMQYATQVPQWETGRGASISAAPAVHAVTYDIAGGLQ